MSAPVWLVLGPPASGKGTQSALLAQRLDAAHLSSGQALRDTRDETILARLATGELARTPDFLHVVGEALAAVPADRAIVLDAVGRMLPEAEWLVGTLQALGRPLRRVVYLDVDRAESLQRARRRGRADDDDAAHPLRWQRFDEETRPVLAYYRDLGLLTEVDGSGSVDDVATRVSAVAAIAD
ncbi:MAG: adenylate kinase [Actinomycetota bacterium]|jgi:adenylate kinase